ncbi:MAG: repair protein SbcD/Mre11 [Actinomycetota bacterium]|jgi:predicted phosphodiesterase|nr:repair protein SbcD/Mre11 [Actinomycetota bacterium]
MRVAAIGDAHLGRSYLNVVDEAGVNQRERDFEESFTAAVDLALAQSPDVVVWLGDVFDHPRPTYRSFRVAQRALTRLREHGVQVAVITGNHDTPRLPGTGSPYSALADTFAEFHFAHRLSYERFDLPGLVIHAVPQMLTVEATLDALSVAAAGRSGDKANLLLTHPRITRLQPAYADINEIEIDEGVLQSDFVLLGHYHVHTTVRDGIWYAGSTDSFTFADDPEVAKGIVVLDTDTGVCRHLPLSGQRRLVTLESIMAMGLSPTELSDLVLARAASTPDGAIARLYLDGVDPEAYRLLDTDAVRAAWVGAGALHLKLEPKFDNVEMKVGDLPELDDIPARWERYIEGQDLTGFDRHRIRDLGKDYLARAVEVAD